MMVVKVGGSVARAGICVLKRVLEELSHSKTPLLIVPGGWIFADFVRLELFTDPLKPKDIVYL